MSDITMEKILADPESVGMPSFQTYVKNRDQARRQQLQELFVSIDKGCTHLPRIKKYRFYVGLYEAKSLEQADRIASDEGIDICEIKDGQYPYHAEVVDRGGLYGEISIRFFGHTELARRQAWG